MFRIAGRDEVGGRKTDERLGLVVERCVELDHASAGFAQPFAKRRMRQEEGHFGIRKHESKSVFGKSWIQRQVGATGLKDGEKADHRIYRSIKTDADQGFGTDCVFAEEMSQAVGAGIQLAVANLLLSNSQSGGIGSALRLIFDELVRASRQRIIPEGIVTRFVERKVHSCSHLALREQLTSPTTNRSSDCGCGVSLLVPNMS